MTGVRRSPDGAPSAIAGDSSITLEPACTTTRELRHLHPVAAGRDLRGQTHGLRAIDVMPSAWHMQSPSGRASGHEGHGPLATGCKCRNSRLSYKAGSNVIEESPGMRWRAIWLISGRRSSFTTRKRWKMPRWCWEIRSVMRHQWNRRCSRQTSFC